MRLTIFSHKACWPSSASPSGFATDGGFPFQVKTLSELFDETRLLVPCHPRINGTGEIALEGHNLSVVPLSARRGTRFLSKLSFVPWSLLNCGKILRELREADAVHAPIPGDVGTVGMLGAWLFRKPLFVRHCGNWTAPKTPAERFWRWFMEGFAGGRNVMLATGGHIELPSARNSAVRWIFSTSLTQRELKSRGIPRCFPAPSSLRLVHVGRQEPEKGAALVLRALPKLLGQFPRATFEIVGQGPAIPQLKEARPRARIDGPCHISRQAPPLRSDGLPQASRHLLFSNDSVGGFPQSSARSPGFGTTRRDHTRLRPIPVDRAGGWCASR